MKVEVHLFATLRQYLPSGSRDTGILALEVPPGSTVADVVQALGIPADISWVAVVDGEDARPERRLAPGQVVSIFPPLAGGGARGWEGPARPEEWYTRTASEASRNPVGLPDFKSGVRL